MEPKFVSKPAFVMVGMKYHGQNKNNEIPQMWGEFMKHTEEFERVINPTVCYGACDHVNETTGVFDYLAAFEVNSEAAAPKGMDRWDIPANEYAVFTCTLPTIHAAFDYIYGTWLPQSGYKRAPGAEFELYDESFEVNDPDSPLYLYIPVKKA
ncbi:MAG: AraC family transcriptional regulator [Ardenticatenaceae bacterium]|nr:AraC family transcriptional regulator [Ardenticatenaceae bacterium]MCB8990903.1 AraC family transcriptional regulator [Ardenticatenaceae bacterium]MCB9004970.1 AraC family transcriptional regulator [Ardenticatenaceae bacterium]